MAQEGAQQLKSDVRSDPPQVQPLLTLAVPIREWGQAPDSDTNYSCIKQQLDIVHIKWLNNLCFVK